MSAVQYIGQKVKIIIDRSLGSKHPKHGFIYEVNYGFVPNTVSGDGEELDAYVLGVDRPLKEFEGKCVAVIHRTNDNDDKLIVIPENTSISDEEIEQKTAFQEQWFQHKLIRTPPTIYLMCGFLGFGKTTQAKQLEKTLPAIRFTHDEIMLTRYGRNPDDFPKKYIEVDEFIRQETIKAVNQGKNVILDYGFWSKEARKQYYDWSKTITPNVYFYALCCDINVARNRVTERTKNNPEELFIDENCFNEFIKRYEPISDIEGYPIIYYNSEKN